LVALIVFVWAQASALPFSTFLNGNRIRRRSFSRTLNEPFSSPLRITRPLQFSSPFSCEPCSRIVLFRELREAVFFFFPPSRCPRPPLHLQINWKWVTSTRLKRAILPLLLKYTHHFPPFFSSILAFVQGIRCSPLVVKYFFFLRPPRGFAFSLDDTWLLHSPPLPQMACDLSNEPLFKSHGNPPFLFRRLGAFPFLMWTPRVPNPFS